MVESHLHGNVTAPNLALGSFVFHCSVMESPLGARQLVVGCVLSGGMAAFSCTLHLSQPLPVCSSCTHSVQPGVLFAAASLPPSSPPSSWDHGH